MNGLEFQTRLIQSGVGVPVVMMTGHGDIPMSVHAMKQGAVDFLAKPFRDQDMLDAVLAAIERDRGRRVVEHDVSQLKERFQTLSPREQEVMLLVTAGKMNKQVAGDLGISEITVKIHRGAATHKMGARTYADLVRMADALQPEPQQARQVAGSADYRSVRGDRLNLVLSRRSGQRGIQAGFRHRRRGESRAPSAP